MSDDQAIDRLAIERLLQAAAETGLQVAELTMQLGLPAGLRSRVRRVLKEMSSQGLVEREGRLFRLTQRREQPGTTQIGEVRLTPSGRAFLHRGEAYDDVMLIRDGIGPALDGDRAEARVWPHRDRLQGEVIRIIERGRIRLTGVLEQEMVIRPDDPRLPSRVEVVGDADELAVCVGQVVLAEIVRYPVAAGELVQVRIVRVLGAEGALLTEVDKALASRAVEQEFTPEVEAAARRIGRELCEADFAGRLDLRDKDFITIDPPAARDFDDAVTLESLPGGATRVWVAVADVSHYVPEGSVLDRSARSRGCSIYLPDRAIAMLPERLSNEVCSLVPEEDRLAMVVQIDVDSGGQVSSPTCMAAVIHSRARLDYNGVAAALEGRFVGRWARYRQHLEQLRVLQDVAAALRGRRMARGALELDLVEAKVVLDQDDPRRVRDVVASRSEPGLRLAYNLIEEMAIVANETVGQFLLAHNSPAIWRTHDPPKLPALEQLARVLESYGLAVDAEKLSTKRGLADLLRRLSNHRASRPLSYLVLRALTQAIYRASEPGHHGLASRSYLHFTSPIRRYPDLHLHRLVKRVLHETGGHGGVAPAVAQRSTKALAAMAAECSQLERRAIELEREIQSVYGVAAVRDRVGDEVWGTVAGLTSFGLFVSLESPFVDGLVKLDDLAEDVELDLSRMRIYGQRTGRVYSLGDRVRVQIASANLVRRHIDLVPKEWGDSDDVVEGSRSGTGAAPRKKRGRRDRHEPTERGRRRRKRRGR
jgi:ribonuclease R